MTKKPAKVARALSPRELSPGAAAEDAGSRNRPAYDFAAVAKKWRARWEEEGIHQPDLQRARRPYLNLMMFPYPSAEGLHVGNMYSYVGSDVHGRWMAMQGFDVFEPIGFDAFGIHSENFALKRGIHPRILTAQNVEHFRRQLASIGNRFDWSHEVVTTDPHYYRWTQWIFIQLFKAGLAERKLAAVNWCPNDKTVLADEQVIAGRCERCDAVVERRELEQWFFKSTRYADRLLDNLDKLDWTERVKALQRNWIGRSRGLALDFGIAGPGEKVRVYTTRPDTIFGVTFIALAPRHPLIETITRADRAADVKAYLERARRARTAGTEVSAEVAVSGVFTGAFAVHPMTGGRVPVWVSDGVLADYGTGAIMGVPAHDARDLAFARTMGLPVRVVVRLLDQDRVDDPGDVAFTGPGVLVESGDFTGMSSAEAAEAISHWCESQGIGERAVRFHLRDWLISRQRYWGPPIPIIYCPEHGAVPVPVEELPVLLPETAEFAPRGTGSSPLAAIESFVQTTCPICAAPARRETDVNDNFLDSAWYFLRYPSTGDDSQPWDPSLTRTWLPPAMYIGGAEHSVLHLMYARFITMALHDLGLLDFEEPFPHFRANGMITKDGAKISKSRGNSVNPDAYIARYGADVFRTYLLFMGPYEAGGDFSDAGIGGVVRFLNRVWRFVEGQRTQATRGKPDGQRLRLLQSAIEQVTHDVQALKYNTAIAALMKYLGALEAEQHITHLELSVLLRLLAPFAPFVTEELWERIGETGSVHESAWPQPESAPSPADETLVVQVNGRVRDRIEVPAGLTRDEISRQAMASVRIRRFLDGRAVRTVVHVPGRLINLVVDEVP